MGIYLGNLPMQISIGNITYISLLPADFVITTGVKLMSSDNYLFKDTLGQYLTLKEEEG